MFAFSRRGKIHATYIVAAQDSNDLATAVELHKESLLQVLMALLELDRVLWGRILDRHLS